MPTEPKKPLIVISYAHADEPEKPAEGEIKWLSFVTGYLRPAIKHGAVDLWLDRLMPGGADWEREIEQKLRACDIFILLVSRHSLSSDYVDKELAIIRERQAKGEAVHFYPLVLTPTPMVALELVRDKNLRPYDGKPFSDYPLNDRYRHMADAADEIAAIAEEIAKRRKQASGDAPPLLARAETEIPTALEIRDEESLNTWLKGQRPHVATAIAARMLLRAAPLVGNFLSLPHTADKIARFADLAAVIFRVCALARVVGKYPSRAKEFYSAAFWADSVASTASVGRAPIGSTFYAAAGVLEAARGAASAAEKAAYASSAAADRAAIGVPGYSSSSAAARAAAAATAAAIDATANTAAAGADATEAGAEIAASVFARALAWAEIRADADFINRGDAAAASDLSNLPIWSNGLSDDATADWSYVKDALPKQQDWDVWIDWYEERLRGGSRGEAYELVFANVPQEEWGKGPPAANAWIKAHLPKE
jgi:TIR domain